MSQYQATKSHYVTKLHELSDEVTEYTRALNQCAIDAVKLGCNAEVLQRLNMATSILEIARDLLESQAYAIENSEE